MNSPDSSGNKRCLDPVYNGIIGILEAVLEKKKDEEAGKGDNNEQKDGDGASVVERVKLGCTNDAV